MDIEQMALMIPILAIVLGIGLAAIAIVASHREKQKRMELRHRERMAALEKGLDLQPDPDTEAQGRGRSPLRSGLIGLFIGILLYFALRNLADPDVALFGLLPAAFGVASLLSHFLESRKRGADVSPR